MNRPTGPGLIRKLALSYTHTNTAYLSSIFGHVLLLPSFVIFPQDRVYDVALIEPEFACLYQ
jgi:hypothetical protein